MDGNVQHGDFSYYHVVCWRVAERMDLKSPWMP